MTATAPPSIDAFVTHARHVPAIERSRFAAAAREGASDRVFVLETCHRVEAYVTTAAGATRLAETLPAGGRVLSGELAVHHAMAVAVGRDSVVVGEDQILHQLRVAVDAARVAGSLTPSLERLFMLALQAGRRARSWRQGPTRSLADVALAAIERQAGSVRGRPVLIVGAGTMGRIAARTAIAAGAAVAVTSRSVDAAAALAAAVNVRTEAFDPGPRGGNFAAVIVALRGPWPIAPATIDALAETGVVLADLSVPAAVPVELMAALGDRVITADALARGAADSPAGDAATDRLDALAARTAAEYLGWLERQPGRAAAQALVERADLERSRELAALWRRLPELGPDARLVIEEMTRHYAERLLREPLERLGRDADGRDERAVWDIFAL